MSFAFSGVNITQSSTDTTWDGIQTAIAALAITARLTAYVVGNVRKIKSTSNEALWVRCTTSGTTAASEPTWPTATATTVTDGTVVWTTITAPYRRVMGDKSIFIMHEWYLIITGTCTITNPALETVESLRFWVRNGGTFTSGTFCTDSGYTTTPNNDGVHFRSVDGSLLYYTDSESTAAISVASGGNMILRGGSIHSAGGIWFQYTNAGSRAQATFTGVKLAAQKAFGGDSCRIRCYSPDINLVNCTFYDFGMDLFRMPTNAPSVNARGSVYVFQYVGAVAGGVDGRFSCSALENPNGTNEFDNFGGGWVDLYNCSKGASLNVVSTGSSANKLKTCIPLYQDINFTVTNLTGTAKDGIKYTCTDSPTNSPTGAIVANGGHSYDFSTPKTYTGTTAGGGLASTSVVQHVWWYAAGPVLTKNLRFPLSISPFRFCGYDVMQTDVTVTLGANAAIAKGVAMPSAVNLALTESQADALTGISFAASGATGGTVTVSSDHTLSDIWCKWRTFKRDNLGSDDTWSYDGTTLNIAGWSMSISNGVTVSGSATGVISSTGTVSYVGTGKATVVVTDASGTTSIVTATNIIATSSLSLVNNSGTRFQYDASSGTSQVYYLPAGSTGTWLLNVAKYGKQDIQNYVVVTGGYISTLVSQSTDTGITEATVGTVAAYTTLGTPDKVYDYAAYWKTTTDGIDVTRLASKIATQCSLGSLNVTQDATAASILSYTTGAVTFKATSMDTGSTMTTIATTGTWTFANGATYTIPVTDSTGTTAILTLSGLSGHIVRVSNDSDVEQDYQTVTGTYVLRIAGGATGTWSWSTRKYGQFESSGTFTMQPGGIFAATPTQVTDSSISESTLATVLAYTTLETMDKFYDYCQAYLLTTDGKAIAQFATKNGTAVDIGSESLTVDATAASVFVLSGGITIKATNLIGGTNFQGFITSSTETTANGARIDTWYTTVAGRSVLIIASSIAAGSQARIYNVTDAIEVDNSVVSAGGIYFRTLWTADKTLRLDVAKAGYLPLTTTGSITSTGSTFLSVQSADAVYVANAIDGSTVTEFSTDYPNIQVDITDPDNITTLPRLYAWYRYSEATSQGIIYYLNGMSATDTANYIVDGAIIDLALDNKQTTLLTISGGLITKVGGSGLVAITTAGSIYFDSGKAYLANSGTITANLTGIKKNTDLIPATL